MIDINMRLSNNMILTPAKKSFDNRGLFSLSSAATGLFWGYWRTIFGTNWGSDTS